MSTDGPKTGIIYCRVSSKEQVEGTSLASQERQCRDYAERGGIKVLRVFVEKGESAKTADRTEFNKAIQYCAQNKGKVGYFIVLKVDRFSRNKYDHAGIRVALGRYGTQLRSVTEPIDESPTGKMMEGILSSVAEFDNDIRTERTKGGMLARVRQGVWCWRPPLGYYRPPKAINITPEPSIAPYIRLAFEEYAKGTYTYESLANYLAERGLRTTYGKKPCAQLMEKILKNSVYAGVINALGEICEGSFEPIINQELFDKCNCSWRKRSGVGAVRLVTNPAFPLRNLVMCTECNRPLTGSAPTSRSGKRYSYYHHHKQGCPRAQFLAKEALEQNFVEFLQSITPDATYEERFKKIVVKVWKDKVKKLDEDNARTRKQIEGLEQERQRIFDLHLTRKYTDDEFHEQKSKVEERLEQKRRLINEKWAEEYDVNDALDFCFNLVRQTAKTWKELEPASRFRFQNLMFNGGKVPFDGEQFGTATLTTVYKLKETSREEKSLLVAPGGIEPPLPH